MKNAPVEVHVVKNLLEEKLFAFSAGKTLARAWNAGENCLLTGPGGYGKTDAAAQFFTILKKLGHVEDENPYVLAFGQGMTEEKLFAGIDIKRFQNEGELIYNLKQAFVSFEYVIFEELFDAFPGILLILKDVLQSKTVRLGDKVYPLRTKFVVACTNKSNEEVATDRSTWALLERFVFQKEVTWTSWTKTDYASAFRCATGIENCIIADAVADISAQSSQEENKISPRTAGKALKAVKLNDNDITVLEDILGFDVKAVQITAKTFDGMKADKAQIDYLNSQLDVATAMCLKMKELKSAIKVCVIAKQLHILLVNVCELSRRDACIERFDEVSSLIRTMRNETFEVSQFLCINPKAGTLPHAITNADIRKFNWDSIKVPNE